MAAKFTASEKNFYAILKMHYPNVTFDIDAELGVTIAKVPHGSEFTKIAIAYCGRFDEFSKKRGKFEAMQKLDAGQFIILPNCKTAFDLSRYNFILVNI